MDYEFKIAIGDWSGDGHGKSDHYTYKTNKPIEEVREAYFSAIKKLGKDYPGTICQNYEDSSVTPEVIAELKERGFTFTRHDDEEDDGTIYPYQDGMLELTEWFLKQGDPELKLEGCNEDQPTLYFYGYDEKDRHIGYIGYGLFD